MRYVAIQLLCLLKSGKSNLAGYLVYAFLMVCHLLSAVSVVAEYPRTAATAAVAVAATALSGLTNLKNDAILQILSEPCILFSFF